MASSLASRSSEKAGTILRIKVENFMCHGSLSIDFVDQVNFITGQNGSGKSAILTALCVAFGIKARGTQRATSLKEFIKNGCSHALVVVEMTNQGVDAFKYNDYGPKIIIERRITESGNTTALKDCHGKKVSTKKDDLQELIDYFNIDVENPCVVMTQDKSREFLHSGSGKDKFKFFFKATLLQQVLELLKGIEANIEAASTIVDEMEKEMQPYVEELRKLQLKLRSVENMEQMAQELSRLRKVAAWSEVADMEQQLEGERVTLEKYKSRISACEEKINKIKEVLAKYETERNEKKETVAARLQKTRGFRHMQDDLQKQLAQATKEDAQVEEDQRSRQRTVQQMTARMHLLEQKISDIHECHVQASQAEIKEREAGFLKLQRTIDEDMYHLSQIEGVVADLDGKASMCHENVTSLSEQVKERKRELGEVHAQIQRLERQQMNKVTAFGGEQVLRLLQIIEGQQHKFTKPPLGPVGAHVALIGDGRWALALEVAIGKLLNAFIVTNHKDMLLLRDCAKHCAYHNVPIIIYDFGRPMVQMPTHMLPDPNLVTVKSVLCIESATIMNVLVDQGSVERQVLVNDYNEGKHIVFERKAAHVKEAFTLDGMKMFTRGNSQTTLPPDSRIRSGRLCVAVDEEIRRLERLVFNLKDDIEVKGGHKRAAETTLQELQGELQARKKAKVETHRDISRQLLELRDMKAAAQAEENMGQGPNVDELEQEIVKLNAEIQSKEDYFEKLKIRRQQTQESISIARSALDELNEAAKGDIEALQVAENELVAIEEEIAKSSNGLAHYRSIMQDKLMQNVRDQEVLVDTLQRKLEETAVKASEICTKEEFEALGIRPRSSDRLRGEMQHLKDRLRREESRHEEPADDIRNRFNKLNRRVEKKQSQYKFYREKLHMVKMALDLRLKKFHTNASYLKKQLTWQFNGHLQKKGMNGKIQVDFAEEVLSIQVQMPQDASNNMVRDTRGLSGGERSFSTLSFVLALQEMTEAPFRAMDEFDVFMDAVSRKISLETVVEFAVSHGSQWIFITPHDISMVKPNDRVKKQQLAAPRS